MGMQSSEIHWFPFILAISYLTFRFIIHYHPIHSLTLSITILKPLHRCQLPSVLFKYIHSHPLYSTITLLRLFSSITRRRFLHLTNPTSVISKPDWPDFVACCATQERIHWTEIDTTVEIHSTGENATDPRASLAPFQFLYNNLLYFKKRFFLWQTRDLIHSWKEQVFLEIGPSQLALLLLLDVPFCTSGFLRLYLCIYYTSKLMKTTQVL